MSDRHVECATCNAIRPEHEARNIPRWTADEARYADDYYCVDHAPAALALLRAHIEGLDLEDDERDDMMPLMLMVSLLWAGGQRSEDLAEHEAGGEGMERVRQQVLALLRRLGDGAALPIDESSALCSACFRTLPASQMRVIPWFNASVGDYVTTFRCGACCPAALAETRAHLDAGGDRAVERLAEFFGRHAVTILEFRRGDPPATVRPLLTHLLGLLERGAMKLPIGPTVPLSAVLAPPPADPPPAAAPLPAPPPADPPRRSLWSRLLGRS